MERKEERNAVMTNGSRCDGMFFYGVISAGIYCRPWERFVLRRIKTGSPGAGGGTIGKGREQASARKDRKPTNGKRPVVGLPIVRYVLVPVIACLDGDIGAVLKENG